MNFDSIFPEDKENISQLIKTFETTYEEKTSLPPEEGLDKFPETACYKQGSAPEAKSFVYRYRDFPGNSRFGKYGFGNVLMVYQIRYIFSGLITDELLGAYLNLIRSHAIIATFRTFQDPEGVFSLLIPEKNLYSQHIDVDENDIFKSVYSRYAQGYSLEEASIAAIKLNFVSDDDKEFLMSRLYQLSEAEKEEDRSNRYLLPSSDIQKIDLLTLVDSVLGLSKLFEIDNVELPLSQQFNTPSNRKMITPFYKLGILKDLNNLDKGITRGEAFTFFYRLQELNRLLLDEFKKAGVSVGRDGVMTFKGEKLKQKEARELFKEMVKNDLGIESIRLLAEITVKEVIDDYWKSWNKFLEKESFPFPDIKKRIFESKNPVVILKNLKNLLR